jgi:hypothetical protein
VCGEGGFPCLDDKGVVLVLKGDPFS